MNDKALLSAMLVFNDCIPKVTPIVTAEDFPEESDRQIFSAIINLHSEGKPVELPTLAKILKKHDMVTVADLMDIALTGETAPYYAREVKKAAQARNIQTLAAELQCHPERAASIIPMLEELSQSVDSEQAEPLFSSASDLLNQPVSSEYLIDKIVECDTTGQIFGPSGSGKTFIALDIAFTVATGGPTDECQI